MNTANYEEELAAKSEQKIRGSILIAVSFAVSLRKWRLLLLRIQIENSSGNFPH